MFASSLSRKKLLLLCVLFTFGLAQEALVQAQTTNSTGFSNYQNAQVNTILDIYEQLSGKHLIRDINLNSAPAISINATGLSKAEMMRLVEATLLLNGITIIPVDDHTMKVIFAAGNTKTPRNEGIQLYANAADLPVNDAVVSYYMPFDYIDPKEASAIFTSDIPPHPYGAYVVAPSAQALIITENASVVRELIGLKELIDIPPARVATEFIQLDRADAEKTADLLTKLLEPKNNSGGAPGDNSFGARADLDRKEPLFNERNLLSGPVQIVPITRSNQLLIVTRPVNMPFLKQLISQLDQADDFMLPQRRALKYVLAQDILPALEASLAEGKDEEDQIKKDGGANPAGNNAATQAQNQPVANNSNAGSNGSTGNVTSVTPPLTAPTENNIPTIVTIGKTRILADNRSNTIVVFGSPDAVNRVFNMIDQLDRRPLQIYLSTVIGELTVSQGMEFGIDILQKFQHVGSFGGATGLVTPSTNLAGSTAVPEPSSLISSSGFPLPTGLTLYGAIGNTLSAYVRALETTNRFKVISRPSVYTTNNTLAVIASGSEVPVPSNTTSGFTGSSSTLATTSSITYQDVLLQLDIIPLINADHQVTLKIRQTNNSLGSNQNISGNEVPTILTQEINTEVTVPDKSTIVIGGLISDTTNRTESGVPYLSDIPLLGYLFKDTSKSKERDELIIMIQPTVVETDADQIAANEAEKQRTILGHEAEEATAPAQTTTTTTTTTTLNPQPAPTDVKTMLPVSHNSSESSKMRPSSGN